MPWQAWHFSDCWGPQRRGAVPDALTGGNLEGELAGEEEEEGLEKPVGVRLGTEKEGSEGAVDGDSKRLRMLETTGGLESAEMELER